MRKAFAFSIVLALGLGSAGCAYKFGFSERTLPGGYTQLAIPMFKNLTPQVGVEASFTDALIQRFARSQVARVSDKESSPITLEGTIHSIDVQDQSKVTNQPGGLTTLPDNAVLTTEYRIVVMANVILRRKSDERIVWQGSFSGEKIYAAPRIGMRVLNSANATYNQSARMHTIALLAEEMMTEAHDRITENF